MAGIVDQAVHGALSFQFGLYVHELLVRDASWFLFLAILAFFIHALAPNKCVGYFVFITSLCHKHFSMAAVERGDKPGSVCEKAQRRLFGFLRRCSLSFGVDWFTLYWLLSLRASGHRHRNVLAAWEARPMAGPRPQRRLSVWFRVEIRHGFLYSHLPSAGSGSGHNTEVLNLLPGPKDMGRVQAAYEKTYKPLDKLPQPRVRSVKYAIDVFPSSRNVNIRGEEVIYNPYSHPLDEIHFSTAATNFPGSRVAPLYDTSIDVPGAVLARDDTRLSYRIYRFTSPLQPGEERTLRFTVKSKNRGFENNVSNTEVVQNGTFLNSLMYPLSATTTYAS